MRTYTMHRRHAHTGITLEIIHSNRNSTVLYAVRWNIFWIQMHGFLLFFFVSSLEFFFIGIRTSEIKNIFDWFKISWSLEHKNLKDLQFWPNGENSRLTIPNFEWRNSSPNVITLIVRLFKPFKWQQFHPIWH